MSAQRDDVRRNLDGSIDFGFYRRRAARIRTQAIRDFVLTRILPLVKPALAVAAVAAALMSMPRDEAAFESARQRGSDHAAMVQVGDRASEFRRLAADLLVAPGLQRDGNRHLWPDAHP